MDKQPSASISKPEKMPGDRKIYIRSYGCQMNSYDAQRMSDLMAREGYAGTEHIEEADLVVLNTCHIRERATEKIYSELGKIRALKAERAAAGQDTTIVVAGCVAQAEGGEIMRREKAVDFVVGPQNFQGLPQLVGQRRASIQPVHTEFDSPGKFATLPLPPPGVVRRRGPAAFLTIQEGCDKFCTFCVVPYTRGSEMSRPVADILAEARALAVGGTRELTLLGQNVNAYHGRDERGAIVDLAELCFRLAALPGLDRLRYTTSHPNDMSASLIAAHRDMPMLMPFVHLPVQSGSDRVLKAMNRRHDVAHYLECVAQLRDARPDVALSSDFIAGFPGETEGDFLATLELIRKVGFASSFSFKYSPRPGTPGAERNDQIDEKTKSERLARLQVLLEEQRQAFNADTVGMTVDVLVERLGRHPGQVTGKTPYLQQVQFDGDARNLIGSIVPVRIKSRAPNSLFGALAGDDERLISAREEHAA